MTIVAYGANGAISGRCYAHRSLPTNLDKAGLVNSRLSIAHLRGSVMVTVFRSISGPLSRSTRGAIGTYFILQSHIDQIILEATYDAVGTHGALIDGTSNGISRKATIGLEGQILDDNISLCDADDTGEPALLNGQNERTNCRSACLGRAVQPLSKIPRSGLAQELGSVGRKQWQAPCTSTVREPIEPG
jgi:hypothetical protein